MGRKPAEAGADQDRRMMVAGSMAAAVTAPLPVLAGAVLPQAVTVPHSDQALLDAEGAYLAAQEAEGDAKAACDRVSSAYRAALGDLPPDLQFPRWVASATAHPGMPLWQYRIERRVTDTLGGETGWRWTAKGLRAAIAALPKAFGRAGATPKLIRHLRSIVPIAEAYEARMAELQARFGTADALATWNEAQAAARLARTAILETVAVTPAGLAVQVRYAAMCDWHKVSGPWGSLMRSAAAVLGVALAEPDFDVARWLRDWQAIGGGLMPLEPGSPLDVIAPRVVVPGGQDEERRLYADLIANRDAITRHVRGRA